MEIDWSETCTIIIQRYKPLIALGSVYAYDNKTNRLISLPVYDQERLTRELQQIYHDESDRESAHPAY